MVRIVRAFGVPVRSQHGTAAEEHHIRQVRVNGKAGRASWAVRACLAGNMYVCTMHNG